MALSITKATPETTDVIYHGVTLTIARGDNRAFRDKQRKLLNKAKAASGASRRKKADGSWASEISAEENDRMMAKAFAGTILVGWSGFEMDGQPVPFTEQNAEELLFNDTALMRFVDEESDDLDAFYKEETDALVKKSKTATPGN